MRTYVRTLPDFTTAIQSGNETTQKSNFWSGHDKSRTSGPAMAGPEVRLLCGLAGPVPALMCIYMVLELTAA